MKVMWTVWMMIYWWPWRRCDEGERTPPHGATRYGCYSLIEGLVAEGAEVDVEVEKDDGCIYCVMGALYFMDDALDDVLS